MLHFGNFIGDWGIPNGGVPHHELELQMVNQSSANQYSSLNSLHNTIYGSKNFTPDDIVLGETAYHNSIHEVSCSE